MFTQIKEVLWISTIYMPTMLTSTAKKKGKKMKKSKEKGDE